ncbi:hypothetical protein E3N88_07596 [Mikania micrantha]|uniref:Uncharacterized protein n=1 Tax=Mikania micrantha TaxID=192012 RepID=A0A5N6PUC5_9ASTR|nr:hypothetical protein E3N88_07596 [Mikania micrantha]
MRQCRPQGSVADVVTERRTRGAQATGEAGTREVGAGSHSEVTKGEIWNKNIKSVAILSRTKSSSQLHISLDDTIPLKEYKRRKHRDPNPAADADMSYLDPLFGSFWDSFISPHFQSKQAGNLN